MTIGLGPHLKQFFIRIGTMPQTVDGTGWKDQPTSESAAERIAPKAPILRHKILNLMIAIGSPLTADEIAKVMNLSVLTVRPRISELAKAGKLVDSGKRGTNASGRSAVRWRVSDQEAQP
ncbi:HTH domain-containing protein [Paracoccus onubensis]|uniref:HTH domain-containing protein n=1 Tax=Paracoccus onubensis TaxID=1675788 RepID=UPI0027307AFF|nr:HTH domain-containing protein [Paracoccus onubensis]MDP0928515.1 HTH domain-containing protein [Paracoccus onubensis]